jgi:hypothetical protein
VDRKVVAFAACQCAREALQFVPAGEERPRVAIETAEAWTRGEATIDEVRASADAAAYTAYAADAASAAAYTAAAAAAAAADAASAAAYAASYAAYAASYAASWKQMHLTTAHIVRKHIPWRVVRAALGTR